MFSSIAGAGRLVNDPELRTLSSGTSLTNFSIACKRAMDKDVVDFFDVKAFGKTAEFICNYFMKGKPIIITGYLEQERWETKDGKRSKVVIVAQNARFVDNELPPEDLNEEPPSRKTSKRNGRK